MMMMDTVAIAMIIVTKKAILCFRTPKPKSSNTIRIPFNP